VEENAENNILGLQSFPREFENKGMGDKRS
jgi:hypothetical protein